MATFVCFDLYYFIAIFTLIPRSLNLSKLNAFALYILLTSSACKFITPGRSNVDVTKYLNIRRYFTRFILLRIKKPFAATYVPSFFPRVIAGAAFFLPCADDGQR